MYYENRATSRVGGSCKHQQDLILTTRLTESSVEAKWKGLQMPRSHRTQCRFLNAKATKPLVYPRHPYSADLRAQISSIPKGFANLASTGELSTRFISMLVHWHCSPLHKSPLKSFTHLPPEAAVFLGSLPSFTVSELLVGTAIGSYSLCFAAKGGNTIPELHLRAQVQQLASDATGLGRINQDAVRWAQLMIRATNERRTVSWQWADRCLSLVKVTEEKFYEIEDAFHPLPRNPTLWT